MILSHPSPEHRDFIEAHEFTEYVDPVVHALHEWERSGDKWNALVRRMFHTTTLHDRFTADEAQLGNAIDTYADNFDHAARTIVTDSPFEDRAVDMLDQLIRAEDTRRRRALYSFYDLSHIPKPSDEFFHDIALAYGDPRGEMLPLIEDRRVQSPEAAKLVFMSNLDRQSDVILDRNRRMHGDRKRHEAESRPRRFGSIVFGRYQSGNQK